MIIIFKTNNCFVYLTWNQMCGTHISLKKKNIWAFKYVGQTLTRRRVRAICRSNLGKKVCVNWSCGRLTPFRQSKQLVIKLASECEIVSLASQTSDTSGLMRRKVSGYICDNYHKSGWTATESSPSHFISPFTEQADRSSNAFLL